ncbi:hypothetical protein C8F04DRAFT_1104620 [Mycena alexandri]|uniref:DUF7330 domain-containing protein n=1 Tax=Mycena alexandri TaxID=1745969 RepID=A0AAD6X5Y9_9AGAR|nr:hypothetical protein C8F04DRAFT_1104620 [Mycena alexandri]
MIVTDNSPKSPDKASTPLLGGAGGSGGPPAYEPRGGGPSPIGGAQVPYTAVYQPIHAQQREGESAGKRFFKAFLVALGIWFLVSALVGSVVDDRALGYHDYPIPGDVETENCVTEWKGQTIPSPFSSFPYSASTTFDFALPSETLLLISKGQLSSGNLKIKTSTKITDAVQVKVTVHYHTTAVRDSAKICMIGRQKDEAGVGIFTPTYWRRRSRTDFLFFDVELTLPHSTSTQYINALSTDVNNFSHDVETLKNVFFGHVSLTASNGKILTQDVTAETITFTTSNAVITSSLVALDAKVRSSNGHINGHYAVTNSLDLHTTNGAIKVAAILNVSDTETPKTVSMTTSNGVLDAQINLGTSNGKPGSFRVITTTTNSGLTTHIDSAPLDSVLNVDARTSNGRAYLGLPSTYEGKFSAATSNGKLAVSGANPNEPDPACKGDSKCTGRQRTTETSTVNKRLVVGSVYWDKKNAARGKASVTTSNSAVTLSL